MLNLHVSEKCVFGENLIFQGKRPLKYPSKEKVHCWSACALCSIMIRNRPGTLAKKWGFLFWTTQAFFLYFHEFLHSVGTLISWCFIDEIATAILALHIDATKPVENFVSDSNLAKTEMNAATIDHRILGELRIHTTSDIWKFYPHFMSL